MSASPEPSADGQGDAVTVIQPEEMRPRICRPKRRGRVMTERRREQNRQAQQKHRTRAKQKRLLEELASVEAQYQNFQPTYNPNNTGQNILETFHENYLVQDVTQDVNCLGDRSILNATNDLIEPVLDVPAGLTSNLLAVDGNLPPSVGGSEIPWNVFSFVPGAISGAVDKETSQDAWNADTIAFHQSPLNFRPPETAIDHRQQMPTIWGPSTDSLTLSGDYEPLEEQNASSMPALAVLNTAPEGLSPISSGNINGIIVRNGFSIEQIVFAGLQSITETFNRASKPTISNSTPGASNASVPQGLQSTISSSYTPSPSVTHLPLRQTALMAACLANAAHIGLDVYEHIRCPKGHNDQTPSVFYQPAFATLSLSPSILMALYESVKPDLRPCSAQITQPHPLYIDTLPFPSFRQRILALRSCVTGRDDVVGDSGEKIFDEEEFCRDIDADGIVCWGSDADIGTGAPWDRRSWECRPWFLRKWWMVTGGPDGELGKQSRWWAEMRAGRRFFEAIAIALSIAGLGTEELSIGSSNGDSTFSIKIIQGFVPTRLKLYQQAFGNLKRLEILLPYIVYEKDYYHSQNLNCSGISSLIQSAPLLEELKLRFDKDSSESLRSNVLESLKLPSLRALTLESARFEDPSCLIELLSKHAVSLKEAYFGTLNLKTGSWESVFIQMRDVLGLDAISMTGDFRRDGWIEITPKQREHGRRVLDDRAIEKFIQRKTDDNPFDLFHSDGASFPLWS